MAVEAGAVYVPIRPSFKGFQSRVKRPSTDAGQTSAGAFASAFHRRLQAAFQALPKAEINADSSNAQIAIQVLRKSLEELSHKTVGVDIDSATALAEVRAIQQELQSLEADSPDIQVRTDAAVALSQLSAVQAKMEQLDGKEVNVKVNKTTDGMHAAFLQTSALTTAVVALAPAAIPVMAVVGAGALGMAASFGAAGIAAGAFGVIAADQFSRVTEVLDKMATARERADKATTNKAREAALKEEKRLYDTLSPVQKKAAQQIQQLGDAWDRVSNKLAKPVFDAITPWINTAKTALPLLPRLVMPAATAIETLGEKAQKALSGPYWKAWVRDVGQEGGVALLGFGTAAGLAGQGLAELFRQWLPIGNQMIPGLIQLTQRFNEWANSARATQGMQDFLAYVKEVAPEVMDFLNSVGPALVNIGQAAGILAPISLAVATALSDIVASLPPGVLAAIVGGFIALKLATAGWSAAMWAAHGASVIMTVATRAASGAHWLYTRAAVVSTTATNAYAGSAARASAATAGLARSLGTVAVVVGGFLLLPELEKKMSGTSQETNQLVTSLNALARTGRYSGAILKEFGVNAGLGQTATAALRNSAQQLANPSFVDYFNHAMSEMWSWLPWVTSDVDKFKRQFAGLDTALVRMVQGGQVTQASAAFNKLQAELRKAGLNTQQINALFPKYTAASNTARMSNQGLTAQINAQNSALQRNASAFASDQQQVIDFRMAVNSAKLALQSNGQAFFGNSRRAIENRSAVLQAAAAIRGHAGDLVSNNRVTKESIARLQGQKAQLVRLIESFGVSRQRAKEYANQLVKIPKNLSTNLSVNAKGQFSMMKNPGTVKSFHYAGGGLVEGYATGGVVRGPGGGRSDSVSAKLSAGEFVMNADSTRMFLPQLMAMNDEGNKGTSYKGKGYAFSRGKYLDEGNPRYASGGLVHSYRDKGGMASTLTSARKGNQTGINRQLQYAVQQTINFSKAIVKELASGGGVVAAARSQLGVPYSWGGGGRGGKSRGIGRGRNTVGFDCSGLTEYAWWKGRHVSIGGTTYSQRPNSHSTTKRPGALGFPHPGHVVIASNKPGQVIEAPFTGSRVREVHSSRGYDWRWPKNAKFDSGGYLPPGLSLAYNGTGKPEPVLTSGDWSAIHSLADTSGPGSSTTTNNFYGKLDLNENTLDAWQRRQEAKARIGRPR